MQGCDVGSGGILTHGSLLFLGKEMKTDLSKVLLSKEKNRSITGREVVSRENLLNRKDP